MKFLSTVILLLTTTFLCAQSSIKPKINSITSDNIYVSFEYGFLRANTDFSNSQTENSYTGILEYFRRNKNSVGYGLKGFVGREIFSGNDQKLKYTSFSTSSFKLGAAGILSYTLGKVTPYISAGISYNIYNVELKNEQLIYKVSNKKAFSFESEVGMKIPIYKGILLNLSGGVSFIPNDDIDNIIDDAANDYIVNGAVGFSIPIFKRKDADGDGIIDSKDPCPNGAEDFDGFQDDDGCPDLDNDYDGIADVNDQCANIPEDIDGFEDEDGCADYDNDGDGIFDSNDNCPNEAEDFDGFEDGDGCPDLDNDGDGIADFDDVCPYDAEDFDGFQDNDGCPDLDNDNDGIYDSQDQCPNSPENFNDFEDDDGCPDTKPVEEKIEETRENTSREEDVVIRNQQQNNNEPVARETVAENNLKVESEPEAEPDIEKGDIVLLSDFIFLKDQSTIDPKAHPQLNKIARLIKRYPNSKWRIEGFDNSPKSGKNIDLTAERTKSISQYLRSRGADDVEFQLIDKSKSVSTSSSKVTDKKIIIKKVQ